MMGSEDDDYLCEKSTRDVYQALALDFDSPEERVIPGSLVGDLTTLT
jgi:hypothetical protein